MDLLKTEVISRLMEEPPIPGVKAKLSQGDIAQKIGLSGPTYSAIKTGKRDMTWTTFLALIDFFKIVRLLKTCISTLMAYRIR